MVSITTTFVRNLTIAQREALIKHVEAAQPRVFNHSDTEKRTFQATVSRLIGLQLVMGDNPIRPRFTTLTMAGREAVAMVLGEYADALVAAGCLEMVGGKPALRPIEVLARLKEKALADKAARNPRAAGTPSELAVQMAESPEKSAF